MYPIRSDGNNVFENELTRRHRRPRRKLVRRRHISPHRGQCFARDGRAGAYRRRTGVYALDL